jgi:hypothetical protein
MHNHLFHIARPDLEANGDWEAPLLVPQMTFSSPRMYLAAGVTTMRTTGTDSRRQDFDQSDLANQYDPEYLGDEKLGNFSVWHLKLTGKPGQDLAYPIVEFWVDSATGNYLKRQDFALSGRLMRTSYNPKWDKLYSEAKKADQWFPKEIRIYDEIDKANSTLVIIQSVDLSPLPEDMFTKAWLETKSR